MTLLRAVCSLLPQWFLISLGLALSAVAVAHTEVAGDDDVERLKQLGPVVPLEQVIDQARARQPGRLLEAEVADHLGKVVYEIEILDEQGRVWELHFNVKTGEFMERERKEEKKQ